MALQQITANDIAGWDSLDTIASSFEKRGLKPRPNLGEENELVLQLTDTEFIVLVEAGPGESATDFKPDNRRRRTNLVATNDYEEFTFLTRIRSWEGQQHGRIKHQKLSFTEKASKSMELSGRQYQFLVTPQYLQIFVLSGNYLFPFSDQITDKTHMLKSLSGTDAVIK